MSLKTCTYLLLFTVCLYSCSENQKENESKISRNNLKDSVAKVNAVYAGKLQNLSGNVNMQELLCQGWELEDDLDAIHSSDESMGIIPFRSYYLSSDSTFVKNPRNALEYGKWKFDDHDKTLTLNYSNGGKDIYKIAALAPDELVVINKGIESETKLKFVSAAKRYKNLADNPFHISNNAWRLHPKKSETEEQIRQRLKEYIHFNILFYKDNLAKAEKTITFYGLPTCLRWYAGGIYMVKEEKINENWTHCFYNPEQAMEAYKMMGDLLTRKYNWPKGNISWVNKNLAVLEQMYERL